MQVNNVQSNNYNTAFEAKLKINARNGILPEHNRKELIKAASKVGTKKDTITVSFKYAPGETQFLDVPGLGYITHTTESLLSTDVESVIGNKTKHKDFHFGGVPGSNLIGGTVRELKKYFTRLSQKANKTN